MHERGFTLVEVMTVCAIAGVLAGVALPSLRDQLIKGRRADAVSALSRLQAAEEGYRSANGSYSSDFAALRLGQRSLEGFYTIAVQSTGPDAYRAIATPAAGSPQVADSACPQLVLEVASGFAQIGPTARCWNR